MPSSPIAARRRPVVVALAAVLPMSLSVTATAAAAPPVPSVTIRVDATQPGRVIPHDFLGLSFEADLLHEPWLDPSHGNIDTLLRNIGTGNLRFSANEVDKTAWTPDPAAPVPAWAKGKRITPDDLSRLGALAKSTGWNVDLGVNFGHFDPAAAASQVVAAKERLGDSLRSVEIGNEPNFYMLSPLLKSGERRLYIPHTYVLDARTYREAIHGAAPAVSIEGPNTAGAAVGNQLLDPVISAAITDPWLDTYIAEFGSESKYLNQHYYPFINTQRLGFTSGSSEFIGGLPSIDKLMSKENGVKQTAFLRQFVAKAEQAGLEPKLSETNSVAKEGREGVTNSFGAALWTVDYLMTAASEGVTGINLHNQPGDCESYSLICFTDEAARAAGIAQPNPNYYSALMASRMAGGAVLPVTVDSIAANVTAHAVRTPDGTVKVIVDNMDRSFNGRVDVEIVGGSGNPASIERMTAAAPEATNGVAFSNAVVTQDGVFTPRPTETATNVNGRYSVSITTPSALLLSAS